MVTGAIRNKVDKIWTDIWASGITNPLTVIEQLTYVTLMIKQHISLVMLHTNEVADISERMIEQNKLLVFYQEGGIYI